MKINLTELLRTTIIPIAVYGSFALFRKYLPALPSPTSRNLNLEELDEMFEVKRWIVGLATFAIAAVIALVAYFSLAMLNNWFLGQDGPAIFQFVPTKFIWMFFPGIFALSGCYELTLRLWGLIGSREAASLYVARTNIRAGFDTRRALAWMLLCLAAPIGIATILAVPMHTSFKSNEISIQHYAKLRPDRYNYKQIHQIAYVRGYRLRSGELETHRAVVIHFNDGTRWSSADGPYEDPGSNPALLSFLSERTGIRPGSFETESEMRP